MSIAHVVVKQWTNLPCTNAYLNAHPLPPLQDPAESVAERLVILAHLGFNPDIWGSAAGRNDRYWPGLAERIAGCANEPDVAGWWCSLMDSLKALPLRSDDLLYEKSLLIRPQISLDPPVHDADVLDVLRRIPLDLTDRCRVWNRERLTAKATA